MYDGDVNYFHQQPKWNLNSHHTNASGGLYAASATTWMAENDANSSITTDGGANWVACTTDFANMQGPKKRCKTTLTKAIIGGRNTTGSGNDRNGGMGEMPRD